LFCGWQLPCQRDWIANWLTAAVYIDNNSDGAIDSSDTLVTSTGESGSFALPSTLGGKLSASASFKILVRIFAASGATLGEQASVSVVVTDISTTNTACTLSSQSPSDVTSVVTGQVRVLKKHLLDTACDGTSVTFVGTPISVKPGECVIYDVTATNEGTTVIDNLVVSDAVPNYTTYTGTPVGDPGSQPPVATQCTATGLASGSVSFLKDGLTLTCGGTNKVNPGGTVTMRYSVRLNTK
jgi:trimeric autotransporter adhesin